MGDRVVAVAYIYSSLAGPRRLHSSARNSKRRLSSISVRGRPRAETRRVAMRGRRLDKRPVGGCARSRDACTWARVQATRAGHSTSGQSRRTRAHPEIERVESGLQRPAARSRYLWRCGLVGVIARCSRNRCTDYCWPSLISFASPCLGPAFCIFRFVISYLYERHAMIFYYFLRENSIKFGAIFSQNV